MKRYSSAMFMLVGAMSLVLMAGGCRKPYDKPEYVDVDTSETAFSIPLEGEGQDQAKFASEKFLSEHKVAARRVQVPHRWNQTGRWEEEGEWIPSVRVVKVSRTPVTRTWTPDAHTGTSAKNEAARVESADSTNFSVGWSCTAQILEEDTAKFLYWYPSGSLATVMDTEMLARIQKETQEVASRYPMDELRQKKAEMATEVFKDIQTFYKERGVTVTNVGMVGGFSYDNPGIQKAIDDTVIAQQQKNVAAAKLAAQSDVNKQIEQEAEAKAKALERQGQAEAANKLYLAKAEADGLREVTKAVNEAQQNPLLLQLRALDVQKARWEKWNGVMPQWQMGGDSGAMPQMLLNLPANPPAAPVQQPK